MEPRSTEESPLYPREHVHETSAGRAVGPLALAEGFVEQADSLSTVAISAQPEVDGGLDTQIPVVSGTAVEAEAWRRFLAANALARALRSMRSLAPLLATALLLLFANRYVATGHLRCLYAVGANQPAYYANLEQRPGWRAVTLEVERGVALRGLVRPPPSSQVAHAPWILFYPGNDAQQLRASQELLLRLAGEQDYGLALFAYRGFDSSTGTPYLTALRADADAIFRHVCHLAQQPSGGVHIVGFSIGGHLAASAFANAQRGGMRPASLTLLAAVNDVVMVRPSPWQSLSRGDRFQTVPLFEGTSGPVLVLQGAADEALDGATQGRAIAHSLGSRAQYVELAGVGHQQLLEMPTTLDTTRDFIAAATTR